MDKIFYGARAKERIAANSSKSEAHRLLICAALADGDTELVCTDTNADIDATAASLCALGASVRRTECGFHVSPIRQVTVGACLPVNESGSTLRFLLPLAASLGASCSFEMRGRLPSRPLSPLYELLSEKGAVMSAQGVNPLSLSGRIGSGNYSIAANVSSQYVSGLLFALSVANGESKIALMDKIESMPYIEMTVDALRTFGADIRYDTEERTFYVKGKERLHSPGRVRVGGDYSGAAFFLAAGAIGKNAVTVSGLDPLTRQGDRAMEDVLARMGAKIERNGDCVTVYPSSLHASSIDASQIPDLVPIIAVAASVADGKTVIYNAQRLRLKESDRIESVCEMLNSLGASVEPTENGMIIWGRESLDGGKVDSFNDHRIAMSAAIASLACKGSVTVRGFESKDKSYPEFDKQFIF